MKRAAAIGLFAAACATVSAAGAYSGRQVVLRERLLWEMQQAAADSGPVLTEEAAEAAGRMDVAEGEKLLRSRPSLIVEAETAAGSLRLTESRSEDAKLLEAAESWPEEESLAEAVESVPEVESLAEAVGSVPEAESLAEAVESWTEAESLAEAVESWPEEESLAEAVESVPEAESLAEEVESVPEAESLAEEVESAPEEESLGEDLLVTLGFAGDINFDENWATTKKMDEAGGIRAVISPEAIEQMNAFDIFMINNEFTYSTRGEKIDKTYHFRADPERVENLKILGADIVLLANNHVFDYGETAFYDTLTTLEEADIPYVGAGRNLEEASAAHYFEIGGRTIAYLAATEAEQYEAAIHTQAAGDGSPGVFACYDETALLAAVEEAAKRSDFTVVSVHWGMEYDPYYREDQRKLAEELAAAGADAVIGSHTHCLEGINFIGEVPVFYSLGNFWFNDKNLYTGMAELVLRLPADPAEEAELVQTRFIPCTQYGLYTRLVTDEGEKQDILNEMITLSKGGAEISADGTVHPQGEGAL